MITPPKTKEISEGSGRHQLLQKHRKVLQKKSIYHGTELIVPLVNGSLAGAE
jgi:hypothetical protein